MRILYRGYRVRVQEPCYLPHRPDEPCLLIRYARQGWKELERFLAASRCKMCLNLATKAVYRGLSLESPVYAIHVLRG